MSTSTSTPGHRDPADANRATGNARSAKSTLNWDMGEARSGTEGVAAQAADRLHKAEPDKEDGTRAQVRVLSAAPSSNRERG